LARGEAFSSKEKKVVVTFLREKKSPFAKMEDLRPSKLPALNPRGWGIPQMTSQAMALFPDPDLPTMRSRKACLPPIGRHLLQEIAQGNDPRISRFLERKKMGLVASNDKVRPTG